VPDRALYLDFQGRNNQIGIFADVLKMKNSPDALGWGKFNLRYIGVFATETDCTAPFVWTSEVKEWRVT
jgi:hypothetical protein